MSIQAAWEAVLDAATALSAASVVAREGDFPAHRELVTVGEAKVALQAAIRNAMMAVLEEATKDINEALEDETHMMPNEDIFCGLKEQIEQLGR